MSLRISSFRISDTFGTRSLNVGPFSVLRITGSNASGKSSILKALGYLFEGGTSPECIRKGAEQSVVELGLSDGTKISKTTRPKRSRKGGEISGYVSDLEIIQPDGTPRAAPQTYIHELSSALAVDPSKLLRIDSATVPGRRELAAELLKLVPITFSGDEVLSAMSYCSSPEVHIDSRDSVALGLAIGPRDTFGLDDLKKAAASITEMRRREGQTKNDTDGAINRLQKALPESSLPLGDQYAGAKAALVDEKAMAKSLEDAEDHRREVESAISEAKIAIEKRRGEQVAFCISTWNEWVKAIDDDIDAQIKALEVQRAERRAGAVATLEEAKAGALSLARKDLESLESESAPELAKAIEAVTLAKGVIAAHARASTLREEIEVQLATHRAAAWNYDRLSEVLQRIESLRLDRLKHLPVAGLVVEDGTPYLDGIEWANVNTARKVEAVIQICCLQTGKLPLILWDDAEHGDTETRQAIEEGLVAAGYQLVEAKVGEGPLTIETVGAPSHA